MEEKLNDQEQVRFDKLQKYRDLGVDPFGKKYEWKDQIRDIRAKYGESTAEQLEEDKVEVNVAGRLMAIRRMGKASFVNIKDEYGQMQAWIGINVIGEHDYTVFKLADLGDIVGLSGTLMKSRTGELTIRVEKYTHICKCLKPLPEKFHGLTDTEDRYRHRYVDMIVNDESRRIALLRPAIIKQIRNYCDSLGFVEVETPVLSPILGGASARPFITHHNALDKDFYLRIATELNLKKAMIGGIDRVYEIGRIFRNEGIDTRHNPEFTTIELYEAYADFHDMMDIAEGILSTAAQEILGSYHVNWLGVDIDLTPGWPRLTMIDAVKQYVGVDFDAISDDEEACKAVEAKGIDMEGCERTWGTALYEAFDQRVEEKLVQPTFITMYPVEVSPLTKRSPKDPRLTERFELFINHCEFANAFSELNDPIDQRGRFEHELALRDMGNDEAGMMDEDFINALEYGLPPTGGMGIGIDRCVMMLTNSDSIRDVILFPTMKPLD